MTILHSQTCMSANVSLNLWEIFLTILDYLAAVGGNPEWSLSYLIWQQIQQSGSRATLQERNKGGDAVGEDDKGKTESVSEQ